MAYEIYRNRNSSDTDFKLISEMYARVMQEDKVLCNNAQKNLDRGIFINGELHPKYEKAPLFFQNSVREAVTEHFDREKAEGTQILPAKRKLTCNAQVSEKDEEICKGLGCGTQNAVLAW